VADPERSEYSEQALARLGEILNEEIDGGGDRSPLSSDTHINQTGSHGRFPQNKAYAQSNLKAYYETEQYDKAVGYANKVLETAQQMQMLDLTHN
jgi:hypothetical protein